MKWIRCKGAIVKAPEIESIFIGIEEVFDKKTTRVKDLPAVRIRTKSGAVYTYRICESREEAEKWLNDLLKEVSHVG